ncbi:TOR complex subunit lst8, partial [Ascosphaera aggregata]
GNVYLWRMSQDENTTTVTAVAVFQAHKDYLTRVLLSPDVKHLATCSADHTAKIWNLDPDYPPARAALEKQRMNEEMKANHPEVQTDTAPPPQSTVGSFYNNNNNDPQSNRNTYRESLNQASHSVAPRWSLQQNFPPTVVDFAHPSINEQIPSSSPHFPLPPEGVPMNPDTQTLFLEQTLAVHQRWVWDCAFSADSAYLVTVCSDHYARLWELSSGQIIRQYNGHHRGAVCVALNDYSEPR